MCIFMQLFNILLTKSFNSMSIMARIQAPTPSWMKKVRNIGLVLTGISAALIASPVALPALVVTIAGYLATAGAVASAVAQSAVVDDK